MNKYTVLLQRPDYIAAPYGLDTYMTHVTAGTPAGAQLVAQQEVAALDACEGDADDAAIPAEDYAVLLVLEGWHNDIKEIG